MLIQCKKILIGIFILINILILNSCFNVKTGYPHYHFYDDISKNDRKLVLSIFCTPRWKSYRISGVSKNDKVYLKSNEVKKQDEYYLFDKENNDSKSFDQKIKYFKFHQKSTDNIFIKIIHEDGTENVHKFSPKKYQNEGIN